MRAATKDDVGEQGDGQGDDLNVVRLRGRLAAPAEVKELPSGDEVALWRLIVTRTVDKRSKVPRGSPVDTLDCSAWSATLRREVLRCAAGDVVEVEGSLRRRFYRTPVGAASRYEVVAQRIRRVAPASDRPRSPRTRAS